MKTTHQSTERTGWRRTLTGMAGVLALALGTSDGAQIQALYTNTNNVSSETTRTNGTGQGSIIGTQFTVGPANLEVAAFGIRDLDDVVSPGTGSDGLITSHPFGVWLVNTNTQVGTLIASNTVPAGTSGWLFDGYRYVFLPTSLYLTNGLTYRIGAFYDPTSGEPFWDYLPYVTFAPSVNASSLAAKHGGHYIGGTSLIDPANYANAANTSYKGPNLLIVPEPSALMLLALGGLLLARRRR